MNRRCDGLRLAEVANIALLGLLSAASSAVAHAETTKALPVEQVDFGLGETVTLRAQVREPSRWVIGRELAPQYGSLAARARAGDAEVAENLFAALTQCQDVPRSREELDAAIALMRNDRKRQLSNGIIAQVRSDSDTDTLVRQLLVEPYEVCEGLTDEQRKSGQQWLSLAVSHGNVDAAIAALEFETDPVEQQRLRAMIWQAGEPDVLGAEAFYYEQRATTSDARSDDLVQAYANQFALNEIAKFFARNYPPRPIRQRVHDEIANDLERIGKQLTAEQRHAAIKRAASIVRSNPNCCSVL